MIAHEPKCGAFTGTVIKEQKKAHPSHDYAKHEQGTDGQFWLEGLAWLLHRIYSICLKSRSDLWASTIIAYSVDLGEGRPNGLPFSRRERSRPVSKTQRLCARSRRLQRQTV